jgi:hypothetical protein
MGSLATTIKTGGVGMNCLFKVREGQYGEYDTFHLYYVKGVTDVYEAANFVYGKWLQEQFQAGNDYCELKPKHEVERSEEHLVLDVRGEVFSSFGIMDEYRFRCEVLFDCPMPDSGHFKVFDLRQEEV